MGFRFCLAGEKSGSQAVASFDKTMVRKTDPFVSKASAAFVFWEGAELSRGDWDGGVWGVRLETSAGVSESELIQTAKKANTKFEKTTLKNHHLRDRDNKVTTGVSSARVHVKTALNIMRANFM